MSENCSNCKQSVITENLTKEVDHLKEEFSILKDKVSDLETSTKVNAKETKMVFEILTEIKDSIKLLVAKIDVLEDKPGKRWDGVVNTAITVLVTAAVTYFISIK